MKTYKSIGWSASILVYLMLLGQNAMFVPLLSLIVLAPGFQSVCNRKTHKLLWILGWIASASVSLLFSVYWAFIHSTEQGDLIHSSFPAKLVYDRSALDQAGYIVYSAEAMMVLGLNFSLIFAACMLPFAVLSYVSRCAEYAKDRNGQDRLG